MLIPTMNLKYLGLLDFPLVLNCIWWRGLKIKLSTIILYGFRKANQCPVMKATRPAPQARKKADVCLSRPGGFPDVLLRELAVLLPGGYPLRVCVSID